jgi:hypothetical protein
VHLAGPEVAQEAIELRQRVGQVRAVLEVSDVDGLVGMRGGAAAA